MKRYRLLTFMFLLCCHIAAAQKLQYSKSVIKVPGKGEFQLLANVDGFHHLLYLTDANKPVLYIFNNELQLHSRTELGIRFPEKCDIRILQLNDRYILYLHTFQPNYHKFISINKEGISQDLSYLVNNPVDSSWNKSKATFQLFNNNNQVLLIAHTYIEQLKKIRSTIVHFSADNKKSIKQILFPFDLYNDGLKEVSLQKNHLFILKTSTEEGEKNILSFYKIDVNTGLFYQKQFESGKYVYAAPKFRHDETDSSFFIYSILNTPLGYRSTKSGMLMAKLNSKLNELTPVQTFTNLFSNNAAAVFMVEKTTTNGWVSCFYTQTSTNSIRNSADKSSVLPGFIPPGTEFIPYVPEVGINAFNYNYSNNSNPTAILITLLNNKLERTQDSLVKNEGNYYKIHPSPFANFTMHNKPYLLLIEEIVARKKGLVLVSPGEKVNFETTPLRVQSSYNFLLQYLQVVKDDYILVPYTNKKEMGLLKVTFTN